MPSRNKIRAEQEMRRDSQVRSRQAGLLAGSLSLVLLLTSHAPASGQEFAPSPVRYTEAREHEVRRDIRLPGSVQSATSAVVAAEVAGLVAEVPGREGSRVARGQPLARLRDDDLALRLRYAEAQLKEAEARRVLAERNLERSRDLLDDEVVSRQQHDAASAELQAWQGRVEALMAEIARYRLDLDRCTIKAPFTGVVVAERTEIGEWVDAGGPVAEMLSLDNLEIRVDVPERYIDSVRAGQGATVRIESLGGGSIAGRIVAVVPRADPQARTFPVKVRIPNPEGRISEGMLAEVSIPAGEAYRATVVPKDGVVTNGPARFVYVLNGDGSVEQKSVRTGAGVGSWIVVEEGVQAGQKIVTRGNERLFPGQKVAGELLEYALP